MKQINFTGNLDRPNNATIFPSFSGSTLFVLSIKNNVDRRRHTGYFLLKVEINNQSVMINGKKLFHQPIKNDLRKYDNI